MKQIAAVILTLLFLGSCATRTITSEKEREIALATLQQGIEFYNTGQYIPSLKKLLEAEKTIPDNANLHNTLGLVYLAMERPELALTHLKKALKINPDLVEAKNNLGAVHLTLKQWDLAIPLFEEISKDILYATPQIPVTNLGWVYYHQKNYTKAKEYFLKALEMSPTYLVPAHGLATIYIETGYQYQAIAFLQNMLKQLPDAAILHSDLARAYESVQRYDLAKRSWEVVTRLEPETSPLAKEAQRRLNELN